MKQEIASMVTKYLTENIRIISVLNFEVTGLSKEMEKSL